MKTKILVIAMITLAVGACKTVKQSQSATHTNSTDVTVSQSSETSKDTQLRVDSSKLTIDKGKVSETVVEETTTTNFSAPDSTGKQHVTSITTTKRGSVRSENKNLQENKKNSSDLRDKSDNKSDTHAVASSETQEKQKSAEETQPARSDRFWVVLALLFLAVLILWRVKPMWFKWFYKLFIR